MADSSKVILVLSVCIGLFFLLVGTLKFTPIVVKDLYFDARKSSIKIAESPVLSSLNLSPQGYRRLRSTLEVVCGLILAFVPGALKHYANILLLALCLTHIIFVWIATATQIEPDTDEKSKDERPKSRASQLGLQACSTELVFSLLLACRLLMVAQNARHVSSIAEEEKEKSASSAAISEAEFAKLSSALPEIDSLPDVSKGDPAEMALCLKQLGEMKRRLEQAKAAASS